MNTLWEGLILVVGWSVLIFYLVMRLLKEQKDKYSASLRADEAEHRLEQAQTANKGAERTVEVLKEVQEIARSAPNDERINRLHNALDRLKNENVSGKSD